MTIKKKKNKWQEENEYLWNKLDDYGSVLDDILELIQRFETITIFSKTPQRYTTQLKKFKTRKRHD